MSYKIFCDRFGDDAIPEDVYNLFNSESVYRFAINHELGRELAYPLIDKTSYYLLKMVDGDVSMGVYHRACISVMSVFVDKRMEKYSKESGVKDGCNMLCKAVDSEFGREVFAMWYEMSNESLANIHIGVEQEFHGARYRIIKTIMRWLIKQYKIQKNRRKTNIEIIDEFFNKEAVQ